MQALTIHNYKQLQPWIQTYGWQEYNSNIVTMLMWNKTYPMYFKIYDHFALVCFEYNNEKHWLMPYSKKEYLKEALNTLLAYSNEHNIPCMLHGVTKEAKRQLELLFKDEIYFEHHERAGDYVYDRFQQQSLSGKKMQKRRNHFNAFLKEYEGRYVYKPIEKEDFASIYALVEKWKDGKEDTDSIHNEKEGLDFLLTHYDEFNLKGGCIYIDGVLEAFNIASNISDTMLQIHVEKANKNIRGIYVAIVKFLLETLDDDILYINREDDMGLDSLRKAKKDMKPLYKERKHLVVFDKIVITHPTDDDLDEMEELWLGRFADENEITTKFFFSNIMKKEDAYLLKNSTQIMGMAFINRWPMAITKNIEEVLFLEGICIHKDFEGCGYMKKLVSSIIAFYPDHTFALQAYNWDIYRSLNFKETHYLKISKLPLLQEESILWCDANPETMNRIYTTFTLHRNGYRIHDISYYKNFFLPYMKACNIQVKMYEDKGYICFYEKDDYVFVNVIHAIDQKSMLKMLATLQNMYPNAIYVQHAQDLVFSNEENTHIALMMLPYKQIDHTYINEMI